MRPSGEDSQLLARNGTLCWLVPSTRVSRTNSWAPSSMVGTLVAITGLNVFGGPNANDDKASAVAPRLAVHDQRVFRRR